MERSKMIFGVMLDYLKRSFTIVTDPYFHSKEIVCATTLNGEDIASRPDDTYLIDDIDSKVALFETIRDSFEGPKTLTVKSLNSTVYRCPFIILNGVCTLHYTTDVKFTVQFTFEKGLKLNEDITLKYDTLSNSYTVRTVGSAKRNERYRNKMPRGASYDRVLHCLSSHGPMSTAEIAKTVGVPENRVSGRVSEMCKCGLIRKCGQKSVDGRTQTLWAITRKTTATRNL